LSDNPSTVLYSTCGSIGFMLQVSVPFFPYQLCRWPDQANPLMVIGFWLRCSESRYAFEPMESRLTWEILSLKTKSLFSSFSSATGLVLFQYVLSFLLKAVSYFMTVRPKCFFSKPGLIS